MTPASTTTTTWRDYALAYPGRPNTVVGDVQVLRGVDSPQLGRPLDLLVYLPPSYHATATRTYPVVFMQDGQNLFDRTTSYAGEWEVDEILESMAVEESFEAIVVGVPNGGLVRFDEYSPWRDRKYGGGRAGAYLHFLVDVLRPLLLSSFRIASDPSRTAVAGSSMGGLFSLWAFFECPQVFGGCIAMSPSVQFAAHALVRDVASRRYRGGRVYVDAGTLEGRPPRFARLLLGLPTRPYLRGVRRLRDALVGLGYRAGGDLRYLEEEGGRHDEASWSRRLPGALRFALL
jgi:predicted alpha/beta superfamily hydrolase